MKKFDATINCQKFDYNFINYVNDYVNMHQHSIILVRLDNLKGIKSEDLRKLNSRIQIRVAGGYTQQLVDNCGKYRFTNGETGDYYTDAVIYTRNETVKIVEEMETIEKGINPNWSQEQKVIYLYERIKSSILYDPRHEQKLSSETRSLRGLITKASVCAGYALIFKEFLDRQGITCRYVEGLTNTGGAHAWNVITINGRNYGFDLTWDACAHTKGNFKAIDFMGTDNMLFAKTHKPNSFFDIQNYDNSLSSFDKATVAKMRANIMNSNSFDKTRFYGTRSDGSKYVATQIGTGTIHGKRVFRYVYSDVLKDGEIANSTILYSGTNIFKYISNKISGLNVPRNMDYAIDNVLLSKKNINASLANGTCYIGEIESIDKNNNVVMQTDVDALIENNKKDNLKEVREKLSYPTFCYQRSDGTTLVIQQMLDKPKEVLLNNYMSYNIVEISNVNGSRHYEYKSILTGSKLNSLSQDAIDNFLSHDRLDECVRNNSGYIGTYHKKKVYFDNDYLQFIKDNEKKIYEKELNKRGGVEVQPVLDFPTFETLRHYAEKYEVTEVVDGKARIVERSTKKEIVDKKTYEIALFAYIWCVSAGIKVANNNNMYLDYAFNPGAENLYNFITRSAFHDLSNFGQIDTVAMFRNASLVGYKHAEEIIVRLFRTDFQANVVDAFFRRRDAYSSLKKHDPAPLYNEFYAGEQRNNRYGFGNLPGATNQERIYVYPLHEKVRNLSERRRQAKANSDFVSASKYLDEIKRTLVDYPITVSKNEYDLMNPEEKLSYIKYKISEARIFKNKKDLSYWENEKEYYSYLDRLQKPQQNLNSNYASLMDELDRDNSLYKWVDYQNDEQTIEQAYGSASGFRR